MPRIVPLVSNRRVCEVSNNADVSQRKVIHIFYAGINSSMVLKSEQQDMEAKRRNKKKKLGEVNFGIHFHCSEKTSLTLVQWTTRGFWTDIGGCAKSPTMLMSVKEK